MALVNWLFPKCQERKGYDGRLDYIWEVLYDATVGCFHLFYTFEHVRAVSCGNAHSQQYCYFF